MKYLIPRILSLLVLLGTGLSLLKAGEPAFLRESIRARGMGNAFTAVANDEMVLFYNPAGLRSVQYNIYQLFNFNFTSNVEAHEFMLKLVSSMILYSHWGYIPHVIQHFMHSGKNLEFMLKDLNLC